jgi:hypothetical protein
MPYSHATERKIRIIESQWGPDWKDRTDGKSIDAVYNELTGDNRKTLFCKIQPTVKDNLDTMTDHHKTGMAEFIEQLIQAEWVRYLDRQAIGERELLSEFSG